MTKINLSNGTKKLKKIHPLLSILILKNLKSFIWVSLISAVLYFLIYVCIFLDECARKQRLTGSGGEISISWPPTERLEVACQELPWLVEARLGRSLFLLTWGHFLPLDSPATDSCPTSNRLLLYSGTPPK